MCLWITPQVKFLDISGSYFKSVSLQVIHYEVANDSETFVHRSGRTGRAGKEGTAILIDRLRRLLRRCLVANGVEHIFQTGCYFLDRAHHIGVLVVKNVVRSKRFDKVEAVRAASRDKDILLIVPLGQEGPKDGLGVWISCDLRLVSLELGAAGLGIYMAYPAIKQILSTMLA